MVPTFGRCPQAEAPYLKRSLTGRANVNINYVIVQEVELEVAEVFGSQPVTCVATVLYLRAGELETPTVQQLAEVVPVGELQFMYQSKTSLEVPSML